MKYISHSPSETEEIAKSLAKTVSAPRVICLIGDLGAGKTAFTRGFASAYGIEKGVSSPTFTLQHRYEAKGMRINHYDLYRLTDGDELLDIGFEEDIETGISLIEWPDAFLPLMPADRITVRITRGEGIDERIIEIEGAEI